MTKNPAPSRNAALNRRIDPRRHTRSRANLPVLAARVRPVKGAPDHDNPIAAMHADG